MKVKVKVNIKNQRLWLLHAFECRVRPLLLSPGAGLGRAFFV